MPVHKVLVHVRAQLNRSDMGILHKAVYPRVSTEKQVMCDNAQVFTDMYICDSPGMLDEFSVWAHQGHYLSHMCYFTLEGCGPCLSVAGSDRCRVTSYPADLQATKAHLIKMLRITLSTYSQTNKEHFPVW